MPRILQVLFSRCTDPARELEARDANVVQWLEIDPASLTSAAAGPI